MIDDLGPTIAIGLYIIGFVGFFSFVAAILFTFMNAGSRADDNADALIRRIHDGDARLSDVLKPPAHNRDD